ncbi:hypothetical protein [Streptococcus pneumoniae]
MKSQKAMGVTLGTQILVADILGSSAYHKDSGAGKQYFEAFPLAY